MRLRAPVAVVSVLLLAGSQSIADTVPRDTTSLTVYAGVTVYPNPIYDSVALLDFAFSINRHELSFHRKDSTDTASFAYVLAQVSLFDTTGHIVDTANTYFSVRVLSPASRAQTGYRVFNRLVLLSPPGRYTARLTVHDVAGQRRGDFHIDPFVVEPLEENRIVIGGLCTGYSLKFVGADAATSRLVKSGYEIIPNPLNAFSTVDDSMFYVYGEIYNLVYDSSAPSAWEITWTVLDELGAVYRDSDPDVLPKPGSSAVITKGFPITGWAAGRYRLRAIALDVKTNQADTAVIPVVLLPPREVMQAALQRGSGDPYDTLSLEVKVNLVTYLLKPDELAVLKRLSTAGQENFLDQYWREHDEDPSTAVIENRLEMLRRYNYANAFFSVADTKNSGWSTDRGRIYMTYGPWDELDEREHPAVGDPYQIWYYRGIKEGKLFVFVDRLGDYEYRLVHSNVFGEIYDQTWQDLIDRGLEAERPLDY